MQCLSGDSPISTCKGQERRKWGGRTVISIPKIPSPASNNRKTLILKGQQKKELPNSTVPKVAETTLSVAPTRVLLSQEGRGVPLSIPAPKPAWIPIPVPAMIANKGKSSVVHQTLEEHPGQAAEPSDPITKDKITATSGLFTRYVPVVLGVCNMAMIKQKSAGLRYIRALGECQSSCNCC